MFKLTREVSAIAESIAQQHVWPLRISAAYTTEDDPPAKVFVMQAAQEVDGIPGDSFSCVASIQQMEELPEDTPVPGVPFYRVAVATLNERSADHAEEAWEKIKGAVQDLADNIAAATVFEVAETVIIVPQE